MMASIQFRWLGVVGTELTANDQTLIIDPYFTRIPILRTFFCKIQPDHELIAEKIKHGDFVLITHPHFDHLMDVPDVVHNTGATALGSANSCQLLAALGVDEQRIRKIEVGEKLSLSDFEVEVFRSKHMWVPGFTPGLLSPDLKPPLKARSYRMDEDFSFLISIGGYRLLTDPGENPAEVPSADILFVFPYRHDVYYESLLHQVQPNVVIPTHWDDFFRPLSKPLRPLIQPPKWPPISLGRINLTSFRHRIERIYPQTKVFVPEIFNTYNLSEIIQS
ncbi:MAG: MBL fold metallo-hydrolase [Dehalococcoidia bacterium]|nr:MAG: MBL fold metallo-hydrolase [Dehalococcoidia bacterium]